MKIFIKEELGNIVLYFINFILLAVIYYISDGFSSTKNLVYFIFVITFNLTFYLIIKYYKRKNIYKAFKKEINTFEDILSSFGNSPIGNEINRLVKNLYEIYRYESHEQLRKQKEHLYFINQWVHNMKTPISVIRLYMQEHEDEDIVEKIKPEIDKLERGLRLALYNARLEDFKNDFTVSEFNLKNGVSEQINVLKPLFIKSGIFPKIEVDESLFIRTDKKWFLFVIEQLLTNSVKYSKGKGKFVFIKVQKDRNGIVLEIEDEGVGIPKKDIKNIFKPFYTGENGRVYGESTGIGLYLVKEILNKLGYKIEVESEENRGTKMKICIERGILWAF